MKTENGETSKNPTSKRVISIVLTVFTAIIAVITAAILLNMIICRAKNKPVSFFGTSFAIVQTKSMEPEIMTGDLILFKTIDFEDIELYDNVVFVAGEGFGNMAGKSIVHKAIEITPDGIVTKGVNNAVQDDDLLTAQNFLGVCTSHSTGWGKLFSFIGKYGILLIVAIVALPFIVKQVIKIVRLSKQGDGETPDGGSMPSEFSDKGNVSDVTTESLSEDEPFEPPCEKQGEEPTEDMSADDNPQGE